MLVEDSAVKVGVEIEVVAWDNGRKFQDVCAELVKADYMLGPAKIWNEHHKYHCSCTVGGCNLVKRGDVIVPSPLVSMTYDATLPKTGAEFIVSPILLADTTFRDQLEDIWSIICKDAVWSTSGTSYHGNSPSVSPSIHLHVSANKKSAYSKAPMYNDSDDVMHALALFSPELLLLADTADLRRGLKYRLPSRDYMKRDTHHGLFNIKKANSSIMYIEWRMLEAAYQNWEYVEGLTYLTASLTRALLDSKTISWLMATGYSSPYADREMRTAIKNDSTESVLKMVSTERLDALKDICVSRLFDDDYGERIVTALFEGANRRVMNL